FVDWHDSGVTLLTEQHDWPTTDHPRRAAISSFGISGTNAHLILEQPPTDTTTHNPDTAPGPRPAGLALPLSARGPEALRAQARRLLDRMPADGTGARAVDVGYSLATGRAVFERRAVVLGADDGEVREGLAALAEGRSVPHVVQGVAEQESGKL
ncbi:ketoacyl-synthetase C-terminal extension domain-containing protein, partial [Streptomyces sp. HPF1205]|uniref:ketoacyl-synthetase C-terminal extension domain-containing protein n=1 Tax=Streptomyces sp. HPF1205 TaxID=2873262 RepID=UPI001CEC2799